MLEPLLRVIVASEHECRHAGAEAQARIARDDRRSGREGLQGIAETTRIQRLGARLRQRGRIPRPGLRARVAEDQNLEQQAEHEQAAATHVGDGCKKGTSSDS